MKISLGAHEYEVLSVKDFRNDKEVSLWGEADPSGMVIRLCDTLRRKPTKRVATTIHEVIHLIEGLGQIDLEEREVKVLGESLAGFLIRNDWLRPEVLVEVEDVDESKES